MKKLTAAILFAAIWWFLMFSPWTKESVHFWIMMSTAAVVLSTIALTVGGVGKAALSITPRAIALGVGSAVVLWALFFVGDKMAAWMFDFAKDQVKSVYAVREGAERWQIALFLCLIGPAEELFWRGYVQEQFSRRFNPNRGFIIATLIYSLVHIWSFNLMLLLAAAVVGAVWGWMYRMGCGLPTLIVSHTLWDVAVLVLFPIL